MHGRILNFILTLLAVDLYVGTRTVSLLRNYELGTVFDIHRNLADEFL